jgi:hypothetical protein
MTPPVNQTAFSDPILFLGSSIVFSINRLSRPKLREAYSIVMLPLGTLFQFPEHPVNHLSSGADQCGQMGCLHGKKENVLSGEIIKESSRHF